METTRICPGCCKPLPPGAPDGLCPECLIKAGLGTGVDIGPDSQTVSGQVPFVAPTPEEVARLFPQLEILGFIHNDRIPTACTWPITCLLKQVRGTDGPELWVGVARPRQARRKRHRMAKPMECIHVEGISFSRCEPANLVRQ